MKDLVILAADGGIEQALCGLLSRPESLGIRRITFRLFVHPERDPGCFLHCHDFLRLYIQDYAHVLVVFDREGTGREHMSREGMEDDVASRLASSGWGERAGVVVIDPELEVWVWSDSPEVDVALGWQGRLLGLRAWLRQAEFVRQETAKPDSPKEAFKAALRESGMPPSASIFRQLAERVSLARCSDPAFCKLRSLLCSWFPPLRPQ